LIEQQESQLYDLSQQAQNAAEERDSYQAKLSAVHRERESMREEL
jgi:hypothetical protein